MKTNYRFWLAAGLALWAGEAGAQQLIVAREGYDTKPVVGVKDEDTPMVLDGRKSRPAVKKARFGLRPGTTYHDAFLTIQNFKMRAVDDGQVLITGTVKPDRSVSRCFVAVEVRGPDGKTTDVHFVSLPSMTPDKPGDFAIQVPGKPNRKAKTRPIVHYFSGVLEMIHSGMEPDEISAAKAKRDEETLKRVGERGVSVAYAAFPPYPEALRDSGKVGSATVLCRIGVDGRVLDVTLKEASAPEFGEEAVRAARDWLFVPAIKDGQFVEADIAVPVEFSPSKKGM